MAVEELEHHETGADVHPYLLALMLLCLGLPVGLVAFLVLWVL